MINKTNPSEELNKITELIKTYKYEPKSSEIPQCGCCGGSKNIKEGTCKICRNWSKSNK